jgi:hypothetical protein
MTSGRPRAATAGSGLTFAPGDANAGVQAAPALDYAADGRLIGAAGAQGAYWTGLRVESSEGGQTIASLRLAGKVIGFGLVTLDSAGSGRFEFGSSKKNAALLRQAARAHRRVLVHLTVHDWAGNKHVYDRVLGLAL